MSFLTDWLNGKKNNGQKPRLNYYTQRFQLRDAMWLAAIGAFCFGLMGFLVYLALFRTADGAADPTLAREIVDHTFNPRKILTYFEVSVPIVIFMAFLISIGIVASHRTAGPIFAMKRHMNRVRKGLVRKPLNLRRNDELQDVAASLNAMLMSFWEREDKTQAELERALLALERGDVRECQAILAAMANKPFSEESSHEIKRAA